MKKRLVAATCLLIASFSSPAFAAARGCIVYEPGLVTLKGKLTHGALWLLELSKPVCIEGKEKDKSGMYPTKDAVKTAVLFTHKQDSMENYGALIDKPVVITGTLYHKFDNSIDQVTMMVATLKPDASATPAAADAKP